MLLNRLYDRRALRSDWTGRREDETQRDESADEPQAASPPAEACLSFLA